MNASIGQNMSLNKVVATKRTNMLVKINIDQLNIWDLFIVLNSVVNKSIVKLNPKNTGLILFKGLVTLIWRSINV